MPTGFEPREVGGVAAGQRPDPGALLDDVDALGGGALVVVAERGERAGDGRVGGDVHQLRAVLQAPELAEVEEAGAGEGGLPPEDAVELDRVTDRLVDLQGELARLEHEVHLAGGALGGGEQLDRLLGDLLALPARSKRRMTS
jgi:hypothetical protein